MIFNKKAVDGNEDKNNPLKCIKLMIYSLLTGSNLG